MQVMVCQGIAANILGQDCGCLHGLLLQVLPKFRVGDDTPKLNFCPLSDTSEEPPTPSLGSPTLSPSKLDMLVRAETASKVLGDGSMCPAQLRVMHDVSVADRYDIGPAVGEGASGVVKLITDRKRKVKRVLKTLHLPLAAERKKADEILNEMVVYLRLDHPNICRLLEVCVEDDRCHLVMEHCFGSELFERWAHAGRYTERQTITAVSQMFHAVSYLHGNNICHRDLKLENWVYATSQMNSRLKLIDFGFSKVMHDTEPMTEILGTAFYMAPELLQGSYDRKCDIWAMGVLVYMLLVGYPPIGAFEDPDSVIMRKIVRGDKMKMEKQWSQISTSGQAFVLELLQREPQRRPEAMEASKHKWLLQGASSTSFCRVTSNEVLDSMQSFASTNLVKRAACCFIAYALSVEETEELEKEFKAFDTGNTGYIDLQEFVAALKERRNMPEQAAKELFGRLDLTGDKRINYSEFLAAACQSRFVASEENIQEAFQRFDVDHSGFISLDNLRAVLGDVYNGCKVEEILAQADIKQNGRIDYDEFVHALNDVGTPVAKAASVKRDPFMMGRFRKLVT